MVTLSVSGNLKKDCGDVVNAMIRLGINGDVTSNTTVLDNCIEQGCRVVIASQVNAETNLERLWKELRDTCHLTCAHASISRDVKQGCVLDVIRPSLCKGSSLDTSK